MKKILMLVVAVSFLMMAPLAVADWCYETALINGQQSAGGDMNDINCLKRPNGSLHPSNVMYVSSIGNGNRSLCSESIFADFRPYVLTPGPPASISLFNVPPGVGDGADTAQVFISTFKLLNGDQYFYFSTDSLLAVIYMNIKRNGSWVYNESIKVIDYGYGNGSIAVMDVIRAGSAVFYNTHNSQYYRYVMYLVNQTGGWFTDPIFTAGVMAVAFSNDGINWVGPYDVNNPGAYNCNEGVCIEYGGVFFDGTTLYIIALEGNIATLENGVMGNETLTYLYLASANDPATVTACNNKASISNNGIFSPNLPGYHLPNFFINASIAFRPSTGTLYLSRGYPYPSDYSGADSIPCGDLTGCLTGLATLPQRIQTYSMSLGASPNLSLLYSGTWNLVGDWGYQQGYRSIH